MNLDDVKELLRNQPSLRMGAKMPDVRVTYRVVGQEQTTTRTMRHDEYAEWASQLRKGGYELVKAEQVRE